MSIRVYLVEDHPVMRETLTDYLQLDPEIELCGIASSAEEASADLDRAQPSVILLDLSLPGRSGLDLLEEVQRKSATPCVVLSGHGERRYVDRTFALGARGYVLKGKPQEVPVAIQRVLEGGVFVSETLRDLIDQPEAAGGP